LDNLIISNSFTTTISFKFQIFIIMKVHLSKEEQEIATAVNYQPEVSIILPFDAAISLQIEIGGIH